MTKLIKIPALTCSLLVLAAQPSFAQSGSTTSPRPNQGNTTGTQQGMGTQQGAGNQQGAGTNQGAGTQQSAGTSVGNDSDVSGGTTNTNSKKSNPKTAKSSKHCTANEDFVKQGDQMVCVPRTTNDTGMPSGSGPR
jgi:hypothetical protein